MAVRTYAADEVRIIVGGIPISGLADGTFVTIARDEQAFNKVTGADGSTSRAKTANRAGSITLTLQQTSPSNDYLTTLMIADEQGGNGVVPMLVKDESGNTVASTAAAWVQQAPSQEFSKDVSEREWVMDCARIDMTVGSNESQGGN
jgi:hypothetical protein